MVRITNSSGVPSPNIFTSLTLSNGLVTIRLQGEFYRIVLSERSGKTRGPIHGRNPCRARPCLSSGFCLLIKRNRHHCPRFPGQEERRDCHRKREGGAFSERHQSHGNNDDRSGGVPFYDTFTATALLLRNRRSAQQPKSSSSSSSPSLPFSWLNPGTAMALPLIPGSFFIQRTKSLRPPCRVKALS